MSFFSFAGRAGATTGTVTIGPAFTRTTDVMSSSRNLNTKENTGNLPMCTNWLALFIQRKIDRYFRHKGSVVLESDGKVHLLRNRREQGGYFDYKAFGKYQLSKQQHGKDKSGKSKLSETREVPAESSKGEPTPMAPAASRRRVKEMLLRALPGLAADHEDWLRPTEEQIRKARASFESRVSKLDEDLKELETRNANAVLIEDAKREKKRCEHCYGILKGAETDFETSDRRHHAQFWRRKLEARWKKLHDATPATPGLFTLARRIRDVDAIAEQHDFVFLPQELCLLEVEIAVEELFDIQRSGMLDVEQFGDLIEAVASGWPGVVEDSQSPIAEDRANAAGCVRALAQLANKGALPREVLSNFREFDAINRTLLLRARMREADLKIAELQQQHEAERKNKSQGKSRRRSKGKGKERESDLPKSTKLEADTDAIRHDGTKLAALHAELMEAERNLRAVGIDIRGVRVDEFYIQGLDRNDPELRRKVSLMLARVALIQEEIAGLDKRYERRDTGGEATPRKFARRIYGISRDDEAGQPSTVVPAYRYPFEEGEVDAPIGALNEQAINDRMAVDALLALGLTAADLEAMKLPDGIDQKREAIAKLGKMGFRNARDVKFQHKMHRKMRDRVFKTRAGRRALRSAFGLTTGQLAAEYLHIFFSSATGKHDNFNHGAKDDVVVQKMKDHWREIMESGLPDQKPLGVVSREIKRLRNEILGKVAKLGNDPESDAARIAEIGKYHEEINERLLAMDQLLKPRQRAFVQAMIRAAVLAARPRRTTGERHFDQIDVYEASRYRKEIDEILRSWGMDTASYEVMIDLVAFSRAEASDLAPGTVTAQRLDQWKKELDPEGIFGAQSSAGRSNKPKVATAARIKHAPKKAMKVVVEHFSGKRYREMDMALIDRIVLSLPAMADMDKVSIRVHSIGQAGFTASAGMGARGSLAGGVGDQDGWILKREGDHFLVRCLGGVFGYVQPGVGVGYAFGAGEVAANAFLNGAGWITPGVTLSFPIRLDKHGQEDFSKIQAYVRALLTGDLPTTEWMAENAGLWYRSDKRGGHGKVAGNIELSVGPAIETPLGPASAGITIGAGTEDRRRIRQATHSNAFGTGHVTKMTDMTFLSAALGLGLSFGYKFDPGIADVASAAATAKLGVGASASVVGLKYGNLSIYDDGIDCSFDVTLDIGPIDMNRSTSVEEAFDQLRPDMGARLKPLLDKETTLENGSKIIFRDGLEKLLKMMRYNDGFLMEWGLRPEVKKEIGRRFRRLAMIRQQHMLETLEARAENEPDPEKKKELERAYLLLRTEVSIHEDRIREMKDPKNLSYFMPLAIYIMPLLFQWDEWTVLDIIGLAKVTHIGVRLQDDNCVCVPIPKEDDREAPSTVDLDMSIEKRRESVAVIPLTSSDDDEAKMQNTLGLLSGSFFPTASRNAFPASKASTRKASTRKAAARPTGRLSDSEAVVLDPVEVRL